MTQSTFTNQSAQAIEAQMKAHLHCFPSEDFDIEAGSIGCTPSELTLTVKIRHKGAKGEDRMTLELYGSMYGVDVDMTAVVPGLGMCKLVKYAVRNTKLPWIVELPHGKRYKLDSPTAQRVFKKV